MSGDPPAIDPRESLLRERQRSLAHIPLMSAAQELSAATTVVDGRRAETELQDLHDSPAVSADLLDGLRNRIDRGASARAALIVSCKRLVISIARHHELPPERTEALLAAGDAAVAEAVDHYDPTGGLPFSSFARWWIERAMRSAAVEIVGEGAETDAPADARLLTALGHLNEDDCRIIELRMGLGGGEPLDPARVARVVGVDDATEAELEATALAKLRHPCTPGDLSNLQRI